MGDVGVNSSTILKWIGEIGLGVWTELNWLRPEANDGFL